MLVRPLGILSCIAHSWRCGLSFLREIDYAKDQDIWRNRLLAHMYMAFDAGHRGTALRVREYLSGKGHHTAIFSLLFGFSLSCL